MLACENTESLGPSALEMPTLGSHSAALNGALYVVSEAVPSAALPRADAATLASNRHPLWWLMAKDGVHCACHPCIVRLYN